MITKVMAVMIAKSIKSRSIFAVGLHQPMFAGTSKTAQLPSFIQLIIQSNVIDEAIYLAVNDCSVTY